MSSLSQRPSKRSWSVHDPQGSMEPLPLPSDAMEMGKMRSFGDLKGSTQSPPDTVWWATKTSSVDRAE
eukprot:g19887.t1